MKKLCFGLLICCLCTSMAHAKDVYHETFTDEKTGKQIEYFDLGEDTTRPYFTQNAWFNDNSSFIVGGESNHQIYKYDVSNHTVEELFETDYLPLDNAAVVGPDNKVYARNSSNGNIYTKKVEPGVETVKVEPLTMTLPLIDGYTNNTSETSNSETGTNTTYTENGLTFGLITNDRWNEGMSLARQKGDKWCRTTIARNTGSSGLGWYEVFNWTSGIKENLRSTFLSFKVDSSRISSDTTNITIEFDYFDNTNSAMGGQYVELTYLTTSGKATKRIAYTQTGEWKTAKFQLTDAMFDHRSGTLQGGFDYDFRIGSGGNRGGLAVSWIKVYPTPDVVDLGYAQGGWHPHVSNNGDLSLTTGEAHKIVIYEAAKASFATTDVWNTSAHAMINPVYPHLVLYSYDNTGHANLNFNRIRLFNRNTMFKGCIFDQYSNSSNGATTGEAVGHESWTADGEHIVAVKYDRDTNIGRSGIIRMDKNGENREYINGDYDYWHCAASPDGRWIVADTVPVSEMVNIVLIDTKTGKSHLVARQQSFVDDPGQAHPNFNLDGTKITFAMARRKLNSSDDAYVIGVGIIDVSDIINDGQIAEPTAPTDFRLSPFTIGFNEALNRNEVSTTVENIDGTQRAMNLYAAVYNGNRLVSVNKNRYYSSDDATLSTEITNVGEGDTIKCFLWDDDAEPIKSSTDTIKMLRVVKAGVNGVVLSWQHDETDMPVLKYEVFRGNQKIGETPDTVYRDYGLTSQTQYTYYVRPVYSGFHVGEDGASITVNADELNLSGTNNQAPSTSVVGPKAGVKASTTYKTVSADLAGNDITENGLQFVLNAADSSTDGYTTKSDKGGKDCRKIPSGYSTSMCCFRFNKDIVPADITAADITVNYYGAGSGKIQLKYMGTDGTTKTKDVASLSTFGYSWKTATVSITDAKFNAGLNRSSDFVITATSDAYIRSVTVTPKSTSAISSERQYVEWTTTESNGLGHVSGGTVDGDLVYLNSSADVLKLSVDDTYMYGGSNNMAWVDITYKDQGTSNIYLYYNTSDPTAEAQTADKQAKTVITCADTGELKTVRIPLIDAGFSNYDGYDFKIGTDNSAYISKVRVLGY